MDFSLNERQQHFQQKIRAFASSAVAPVATDCDRRDLCPPEIVAGLSQHGLLGTFVPAALGGGGEDYLSYVAALEEISNAWASLGAIVTVHNSLVCYPILRFGDE